jgi:ribosomal protein L7/L12
MHREATGAGLKEAKDAVEAAMDRDPRMAEIRGQARAEFARRVMGGEPGGGQ